MKEHHTDSPLLNDGNSLERVFIDNELYFKISDVDSMPPFFMSIISNSNHWMFIASNGGVTAGRVNADKALFPYYTDDKLIDSIEHTGSKTIIRVMIDGDAIIWEPFSIRKRDAAIIRNLYKSSLGNSIIFEEVNTTLNMTFTYQWCSSDNYGFVRKSTLINDTQYEVSVRILDGIQNIMPAGISSDLQNTFSNLVNAYKYSELDIDTGLGIYALSAKITDRAEPSEALFANTVWSTGLPDATILLSSMQCDVFREGGSITQEFENKGNRGAYFLATEYSISAQEKKEWMLIANVHQSQSQVIELCERITTDQSIIETVQKDIALGSLNLREITSITDGLHVTSDRQQDARHYSNVLFNTMRGGLFDKQYRIDKKDFCQYIQDSNSDIFESYKNVLHDLEDSFSFHDIQALCNTIHDQHFTRIALEYLPLSFSRRHGDPSRPWNRFSINTKKQDGTPNLDYQGNWRDIFQNWEALAHSFPLYLEGMIRKFVNASTCDGYNPYRVLKNGFDWEIVESHNPWSYIGYWGDHQIIYLLKLLELLHATQPHTVQSLLLSKECVYAHVPYRIKEYKDIILNPKHTVDFDDALHEDIIHRMKCIGSDGALLRNAMGDIHHVDFIEKIITTILARLTNYIPEGGIWMNTQRPEWNDANNALVGNGISMVTLYYLHRCIVFISDILEKSTIETVSLSMEVHTLFESLANTVSDYEQQLHSMNDESRRSFMDELGEAGSNYRRSIYKHSFSGSKKEVSLQSIQQFLHCVLKHIGHTIEKNKRDDGLYHAYNILTLGNNSASIEYLPEMLEGQVAVISSGYLSVHDSLSILDSLRSSSLFREDQQSYMLYPLKQVPKFLEKNIIPSKSVESSALLMQLMTDGDISIIEQDIHGRYHFNGHLTNTREFQAALQNVDISYHALLHAERTELINIYESVFQHRRFTGRSGTFFAYEGIGSIYWHMVSKLRYAVQELQLQSIKQQIAEEDKKRINVHYEDICTGIGVHKSPKQYGAFPTDPYSHTPYGKGVQQPGMTGQVKEDVICRFRDMGIYLSEGMIHFLPSMMNGGSFTTEDANIDFVNLDGKNTIYHIPKDSIFFSICQIPIICTLGDSTSMAIHLHDNSIESIHGLCIDAQYSRSIFARDGLIRMIRITIHTNSIAQ